MKYYEDPILGKGRAADVTGGTGGGGTTYIGGFAIGISGDTISRLRYMPIESVTGNSVTLQAGHAYKAYATSTAITLNTETVPEGQFGLEGHIEIYVAGTGYVVTGTNVVLANALEPDSVNNCTLRFHDGVCIISVEDHVAGYIVVNGATSGEGSLAYGIATSTNDYVAFDASLNGSVIPLAGAVAEGEKHLVGNGYTSTTLTGAVNCGTSKFTVANLALSDVQVTGGVMTLGDAYIPSGSTVAVSGGGLAVEKVTGNGGVIDLGQTNTTVTRAEFSNVSVTNGSGGQSTAPIATGSNGYLAATSCSFYNNSGDIGGAVITGAGDTTITLKNCTLKNNTARNTGGGVAARFGTVNIESSVIVENTPNDIFVNATVNISGSTVAKISLSNGTGKVVLSGYNVISSAYARATTASDNGSVTLTSGATLDLTGNTNSTPIAPGGGIVFEAGGATVYPSAGQASAYMLGGITVPQLHNTNVINTGAAKVTIANGDTAYMQNCEISGNTGSYPFTVSSGGSLILSSCTITNNGGGTPSANYGVFSIAGTVRLKNCSGERGESDKSQNYILTRAGVLALENSETLHGAIQMQDSGTSVEIKGNCALNRITGSSLAATGGGNVTISGGAVINLANSINTGGTIDVLVGGCTVNGNAIAAGTYTQIDSNGQPT